MALNRMFKETVRARALSDSEYKVNMLQEAVAAFINGDIESGKSLLHLYVNATVGFQALSKAMDMAPQSLTRMLGPDGNPRANNLCAIFAYLQEDAGVQFRVICEESEADSAAANGAAGEGMARDGVTNDGAASDEEEGVEAGSEDGAVSGGNGAAPAD